MGKVTTVIVLAMACVLLAGCAGFMQAPVVPPLGFVFTDYKAPLDADYAGANLGSKVGTASTMNILGLVALGDASVKTAAGSSGISAVQCADYEFFNVLGIYSKFTLIVYGD